MGRTRTYDRKTIQYFTDQEEAGLFRVLASDAGNPRDLAIFEVGLHRGMRAGEVGLLQLADLRLDARRLRVHRLKNGNGGEYPLTDREVRALRRWIPLRGTEPGPLFPSRNKLPISTSRLDQLMRHYGELAGLPETKRHFHCLRHTCGTILGELLGDPAEVMDHLGHRDIRSTMVYLRIRNRRRQEIGERLASRW